MQLLHCALHPRPGKEPPHRLHPAGSEDALGSGEADPPPTCPKQWEEGWVLVTVFSVVLVTSVTAFICRVEVVVGFRQWLFISPHNTPSQTGKGGLLEAPWSKTMGALAAQPSCPGCISSSLFIL